MRGARAAALALCALAASRVAAECADSCNGHGRCVGESQCQCYSQWEGPSCYDRICPSGSAWASLGSGTDQAHMSMVCSNRGQCNKATGICHCQEGFEGLACNRSPCPSGCNSRGTCRSMRQHAKDMDASYGPTHVYYTPWDADMIYGCECDSGFTGFDCSQRVCPRGDDPLTTGQVEEVQIFECQKNGLTDTSEVVFYIMGYPTIALPASTTAFDLRVALEATAAMGPLSVIVTYAQGTRLCKPDVPFNTVSVTYTQTFGKCVAASTCMGNAGDHARLGDRVPEMRGEFSTGLQLDGEWFFAFDGDSLSGISSVASTKESDVCSNRGVCDTLAGECQCSPEYGTSDGHNNAGNRGDCGYAKDPVTACPGLLGLPDTGLQCSGHGVCADFPTYRCKCNTGWMGSDCSLQTCPFGFAWFDSPFADNAAHAPAECSNRGICDRKSGSCDCQVGFAGAACDRIECPGLNKNNPAGAATGGCSEHGQCLTMSRLVPLTQSNGENQGFTYGMVPNNPLTWDFGSVYGCACDKNYEGYDCGQRSCPVGDDPQTPGAKELQVLRCTASSAGTFQLTFRDFTTSPLSVTSTATDIAAALAALPSVGVDCDTTCSNGGPTITVEFDDGKTAACTAYPGTVWRVMFKTDLGVLPAIKLIASKWTLSTPGIPGVQAATYQDGIIKMDVATGGVTMGGSVSRSGTMENALCSKRGVCDLLRGECMCFANYGSSDSSGGTGGRGDCGHIEPYVRREWLDARKPKKAFYHGVIYDIPLDQVSDSPRRYLRERNRREYE